MPRTHRMLVMSVRHQLLFGFGTLVLIVLLTGAFSVARLRITSSSQGQVAHELAERITALEQLRVHAERLVSTNRGYLLTENAKSLQQFEEEKRAFQAALGRVRSSLDDERTAQLLLASVGTASVDYLSAADLGIKKREQARMPEELWSYFDDVLRPARASLDMSLDRLSAAEWKLYAAELDASRRAASVSGALVAGATLAGLVLSIGLALTFSRRFARMFEAEQRALESARRASAARQELLSIVSHDLRNPLGAILLGASALKQATGRGEVPHRSIDSIIHAGERMNHLIETVLASSSIEAGTLSVTRKTESVRPLLEETLAMFERNAEAKGIRLTLQSTEDLDVDADSGRLLQVLSNLVGNALKFAPQSSTITIGAEPDRGDVRFFVRDAGPGIRDDQVPRLFERHWQAHRGKDAGLGLGLYIAHEIVALHGGRLWVETKLGAGSTFFFTIPSADHHAHPSAAPAQLGA